jgi:AcrR family transcriptional regulator
VLMQPDSPASGVSAPFPHPYATLNFEFASERTEVGRPAPLWIQVRNRRASILAAARRSIANREQKSSIRDIALEAGVSSPTIYNLVGGRREVLIAAVNDHTIALGRFARMSTGYPHFFLGLARAYWESARIAPDFMRSITLNYLSSDLGLHEELRVCGVRMLNASLRQSEAMGLTRPGTNIRTVAQSSSALIVAAIHEWTIGSCGYDELRIELENSVASMLMSAVKPCFANQIEGWLATVH